MSRATLSFVSVGLVGSLTLVIADGCSSSSNLCALGADGCGCNSMGTCNTGLTCFPQPSPINGVCLTSSSVANIMGGGGTGGTDASGDSPLLLTDSGGANDGTGVGVTDGPQMSDTPVTSESGGGDAPATSTNLITNGNFSSGTMMWGTVSGSATLAVTGGQLCLTSITPNVILAWPQPSGTAGPAL